jgi:hypothetical protein
MPTTSRRAVDAADGAAVDEIGEAEEVVGRGGRGVRAEAHAVEAPLERLLGLHDLRLEEVDDLLAAVVLASSRPEMAIVAYSCFQSYWAAVAVFFGVTWTVSHSA